MLHGTSEVGKHLGKSTLHLYKKKSIKNVDYYEVDGMSAPQK